MTKSLHDKKVANIEINSLAAAKQILDGALDSGCEVILGKRRELRLAFTCLLAEGHLLIEDMPGVGKTTLAHLIAKLLEQAKQFNLLVTGGSDYHGPELLNRGLGKPKVPYAILQSLKTALLERTA